MSDEQQPRIEYETNSGIAVVENVDPTPARTARGTMSRIQQYRERFDEISTPRMPTGHFLSLLATKLMADPGLMQCRFDTLLRSALQAHAWALDPTGARNSAHLVKYKDTCQLIVGYGGLIDLVTRDGRVVDIDAQVVYPDDSFDVALGTEPKLIHKPNLFAANRGRSGGVAYYAVATFREGHRKYTVMTRQEVDDIRRMFAKDTPAWRNSFDQQALKCTIHRLCKTLPVNVMASQALRYIETSEFDVNPRAVVDTVEEATQDQSDAIKEAQERLAQEVGE